MTKVRRRPTGDEWDGMDRRHWHFDKRISLDTIVAVVGMGLLVGGPILVWGRAMESRVQALEVMQGERQKGDVAKKADVREQRAQLAATPRQARREDEVKRFTKKIQIEGA